MKAVVVHQYGGPEVLKFEDYPDPVPGPGEVMLMFFWAVVTAREREDQRIVALQLAEPAQNSRMVGQLVVRERATGCDVGAHVDLRVVVACRRIPQ